MFCVLKNANHLSTIMDIFKNMDSSENNGFTDVTLVCDDSVQLTAHKLVLCAASDNLGRILQTDGQNHSTLILAGVSQDMMDNVKRYIYGGDVNMCKTKFPNFVQVMKSLGIKTNSLEGEIDEKLKIEERLKIDEK